MDQRMLESGDNETLVHGMKEDDATLFDSRLYGEPFCRFQEKGNTWLGRLLGDHRWRCKQCKRCIKATDKAILKAVRRKKFHCRNA